MANFKWRTRGQVLIAARDDDGNPGAFNDAGCADLGTANIALNENTGSHIESCTGQDLEDATWSKGKSGEFSLGLTDYTTPNLLMALNGTVAPAAGSATVVSNEDGPVNIEDGQYAQLGGATPHQNITGLVVTDIGSPGGVLVLDTDYTLDAVTGLVKFLTAVGQAQFDYSHTDMAMISLLSAGTLERWVKFNGFNTQNGNKKELIDLYRVRFAPTNAFSLLPDDLGVLTLAGKILADTNKPVDGALGRFGSIHREA